MRKSRAMLILMTLLISSLAIYSGGSEGTDGRTDGSVTAPSGALIEDGPAIDPGMEMPADARMGPEPAVDMDPSVSAFTEPVEYFYGTSDEALTPAPPTRGAINTSTLIYIKKAPKKVNFNVEFTIEIELLEDNNSDEEKNSGDYPLVNQWVHFIWADGTEEMVDHWNTTDENGTIKLNLTGNMTSVLLNGDPNGKNPGIELVIEHMGTWTTTGQGSQFYNLTPNDYNKLADKAIGRDDDEDANQWQNNNIDDDGDGVIDDGRPGIDALGAGEPPDRWHNGLDDDGDGVIDDGYPGIPIMGDRKEGVDEELYNGLDDDGDGKVDEDPFAFIARRPSAKRLYIEVWHRTKMTIEVENDLIDIGKGESVRVTGTLEDISTPEERMLPKTVRLNWDGYAVAEAIALPQKTGFKSEFEFIYTPPWTEGAGPHELSVEFSPGFNKTNNYYYEPSNASASVYIRRPTLIIFNNIDPIYDVTWVYRGHTIYINGSIVDKFMYERQFIKSGPKLSVSGVDYGTQYRFNVMWGESLQTFAKMWTGMFLVQPDGNFSIEYPLPSSQPLGSVTVTVETNFDQSRFHDPLVYYSNSDNSTTFVVRSRTELQLFLDQNNNEINDETEQDDRGQPLDTYITRKPFTGPDGKLYDWQYARIRGILLDVEQSVGALKVGIPNQKLTVYWGFGQTWQVKYEDVTTDQNGRFFISHLVPPSHPLGPVPILAVYTTNYYSLTDNYDSSSYKDFDGQPFSVVSFTEMQINTSVGIKGQAISVRGILKDDRLVGVGNRTVSIYRRDSWDGSFAQIRTFPGTKIGEAVTDATGKFIFREYVLEDRINVGAIYIVAYFAGSTEFPDPTTYVRYFPNDAYKDAWAIPSKLIVTSETVVVLRETDDVLVRGRQTSILGNVFESFQGKTNPTGVSGQAVTAYLQQGEQVIKVGTSRTRTEPGSFGSFEIKIDAVPKELSVGEVQMIVRFTPEMGPDGVPLYQPSQNVTSAQVWSQTRINDIHFGPEDVDGDRRFDFYEDEINNWVFTFEVLEGSGSDAKSKPVQFGIIWMNITMGAYTNSTRLITDLRGRVNFNYTATFKDSNTGFDFQIPAGERKTNMTVTIKFVGKEYYESSGREWYCTYHAAKTDEINFGGYWWVILLVFLVIVSGIVTLVVVYRWIEKRRRLRALKKIIKKAADQL